MVMIINPYNTSGGSIQIGSGNATDVAYPVQFYFDYSVSAFILSPTELSSVSGKSIYRIEYEMRNTVPPSTPCNAINQTLSLGHYNSSGFPGSVRANLTTLGATLIAGLTDFVKVRENFTWTVPSTNTLKIWVGVDFTTPFVYNGAKFLIIHWLSNDSDYTLNTQSSPFCHKSSSSPTNSVMYWQQDNTAITNEATVTNSNGRPNIKIYWS